MLGTAPRLLSTVALILALASTLGCAPASPAPATKAVPPERPQPTAAPAPSPAVSAPTSAPAAQPASSPAPAAPKLALQWFGQSTFLVTSSAGTRLLMDPTNPSSGYSIPSMAGIDVVTVSHEHADHNYVALAQGTPTIVRGLKDGDWVKLSETIKDLKLQTVATFHDPESGAKRGKNSVFLLEVDGLRIAHLGDLGHTLSQEQRSALNAVDILLIPVGGGYTLDAKGATEVVGQMSPRAVVPVHYRTPKVSAQSPLAPVDAFLEGKKVEKVSGNKLEISKSSLPSATTVYHLGYEP